MAIWESEDGDWVSMKCAVCKQNSWTAYGKILDYDNIKKFHLDVDDKNRLAYSLKKIEKYNEETSNIRGVKVRSSPVKGFHVLVELKKPIKALESFVLRYRFGDDVYRVDLDIIKMIKQWPIDIIFPYKIIGDERKEAGRWKRIM